VDDNGASQTKESIMRYCFTQFKLIGAAVALLLGLFGARAADAAVQCVAGPLTSIEGTTCDVGNLEYTFGQSQSSETQYFAGQPFPDTYFTFTPMANGFAVSGAVATVTGTATYYVEASATIDYSVAALGNAVISDISVSCGPLVGIASCTNTLSGNGWDLISTQNTLGSSGAPAACVQNCTYGSGQLTIFDILGAAGGGTSSWDPSTSAIVNVAGGSTTPVPLPSSAVLMLSGLAALCWRHRRSCRPRFRNQFILPRMNPAGNPLNA
jgi:hypothetical protein